MGGTVVQGLTSEQAEENIKRYGFNEIEEKKEHVLLKFLKKFISPIPLLLELTMLFLIILGKYYDSLVILGLLIFNVILSFSHEISVDRVIQLLKKHLDIRVRVLRDGQWKDIPSRLLTMDDIVLLQSGFIVPADIEILEGNISVDQSSITGESLPKSLKSGDVAYMGSLVVRGEAIGKVVAVGSSTFYGKSAKLVQEAGNKTQLEIIVFKLVEYLSLFSLFLIVTLLGLSVVDKKPLEEVLPLLTVLLIPIIPVALPTAFTIATALGAKELAQEGILVTKLSAIESAAGMDILCIDKTGTITKSKIQVTKVIPYSGFSEEEVICMGALASDPKQKDPIENAIYEYLSDKLSCLENYEVKDFEPFDPSKKYSKAKVLINQEDVEVYKGSPKVAPIPEDAHKIIEGMALEGLRIICVWKVSKGKVKFLGFIGFSDPIREDSKKLIDKLKALGVNVKMLTGDTKDTAKRIASLVGIEGDVCDTKNIREECGVFAEVFPEDKFSIVRAFQKMGHIVGMTGDGINDAPALKQADLGIAVSNATDVAKSSASAVLTKEGLTNMLSLIILSRKIYQRLLTYVFSKTIRVFLIILNIFVYYIIYNEYLLTTKMVLSLFFFNDFITISLATDNVTYSKKPEKWNIKRLTLASFILGLFCVIWVLFLILFIGKEVLHLDAQQTKTLSFLAIVLSIPVSILSIRDKGYFIKTPPSKYLLVAMTFSIIASNLMAVLGIFMFPIDLKSVLFADIFVGLMFLPMNILKAFIYSLYE
ncbi:plasma-membrane proton-efflux P-type ATPase [Hydrogenobacter thermophilus]|uniref:plasma-membrane proton-efflux P-type ATPase n=1 Tax=Hydrogenobacter thermophilus TaxID=940 RepID=UPI0030FC0389